MTASQTPPRHVSTNCTDSTVRSKFPVSATSVAAGKFTTKTPDPRDPIFPIARSAILKLCDSGARSSVSFFGVGIRIFCSLALCDSRAPLKKYERCGYRSVCVNFKLTTPAAVSASESVPALSSVGKAIGSSKLASYSVMHIVSIKGFFAPVESGTESERTSCRIVSGR